MRENKDYYHKKTYKLPYSKKNSSSIIKNLTTTIANFLNKIQQCTIQQERAQLNYSIQGKSMYGAKNFF